MKINTDEPQPTVREMVEAVIGCVAGAVPVPETKRMAREAGLTEIMLAQTTDFLRAKADWNDPLYRKFGADSCLRLPSNSLTQQNFFLWLKS